MKKIEPLLYAFFYKVIDYVKGKIQKYKFLAYYQDSVDQEICEIKDNIIEKGILKVFNYPFTNKYQKLYVDVKWDAQRGMWYVEHNDRNMYFKRGIIRPKNVSWYYRSLLEEQDEESPHRYLSDDFIVDEGSVVVDAGAAEGNFALSVIDRASKILLIEYEEGWIQALQETFCQEIANGKVEIISKKLGKNCTDEEINLDYLYNKYGRIDFVKMDIEGAEQDALRGGAKWLSSDEAKKVAVCTYHTPMAYDEIYHLLDQKGFIIKHSNGYMCLNPLFGFRPPYARRGMIRAEYIGKEENSNLI